VMQQVSACCISVHAGSASFFLLLSSVPLTALALGLLRILPFGQQDLLIIAEQLLSADFAQLLRFLMAATNPVAVVSLSAPIALWTASKGTLAVLRGLSQAYALTEKRSWLRLRLHCLADTLLFPAFLPGILFLFADGAILEADGMPALLRFPAAAAALTAFLMLIHRYLPDHRPPLQALLPGSLFTACAWIVFSRLYAFYLRTFSGPGRLYGNLAAVAATLLWLYFCMELLFLGAVVNRLFRQKKEDPQD